MRTTSSHRMEPVGGACKRQGMPEVGGFVVKALSAATTRRGSAWQASKDVLSILQRSRAGAGARASKKSAGSVDGVDRKIDSRGSKARITHRRTEAGEANYLSKPSTTLMTRIMRGRSRWASLPTDDAQFAIRASGSGKVESHCEWRVSRRPRRRQKWSQAARSHFKSVGFLPYRVVI
jgi:hypothetical protein